MYGQSKIYRFKFSENFLEILKQFSYVHQYEPSKVFKENYNKFTEINKDIIIREKRTLIGNGYNGDLNDKIYRSARYYFKNKDYSNAEKNKDKKKRRPYIKQNADFINLVDQHIATILKSEIKPSEAFKQFKENKLYLSGYKNEVLRISNYLESERDIINKIKKTYKNRFFIQQKT